MPCWKPLYAEANTEMSRERVASAGTEGTELGHDSDFHNLQEEGPFLEQSQQLGKGR